MNIFLSFIINLIVGTFAIFWVVGRFSPSPPNLQRSLCVASIMEVTALVFSQIPFFGWLVFIIIGIFTMYQLLELDGMNTFFAIIFYGVVKIAMIFIIALTIAKLF